MNLPFFTGPDAELVRSTTIRDPMGLLPVWSSIGRELVPNLASGVVRVDGVKAVLLIHWLAQAPMKPFVADKAFRQFFRLMEGVIEWHLYQSSPEPRHIFGRRALSSPDGFRFNVRDGGTVTNGLYQYYSGTCRRAGLLDAGWGLMPEVAAEFHKAWPQGATDAMAPHVSAILGAKAEARNCQPAELLTEAGSVKVAIERVLASTPLTNLLKTHLLGGDAQVALAGYSAGLKDLETDKKVAALAQQVKDKSNSAHELAASLVRVEHCEQFLMILQDAFDLLRASPGQSVGNVAALYLAPHWERHRLSAHRFIELRVDAAGDRAQELEVLAQSFEEDKSGTAFLARLMDYHLRLMKGRGAEPLVLEDEKKIVAPSGDHRDLTEVLEHLKEGSGWFNDYYLSTAGTIHTQLFKEAA